MTQRIDITPSWESLIPVLVKAAAKGSKPAMDELRRLAQIVDKMIEEARHAQG
jgi:hypothetical protein